MADQLSENSFFSLQKYYMDMVTVDGQYFIGYSARLKIGSIKINYCATVSDPSLEGVKAGPVIYSTEEPVLDGSELRWRNKRLGFEGLWTSRTDAINLNLLETSTGVVNWKCLQPSSKVELEMESGEKFAGFGYAELLSMTIIPWKLGLKTLYWGRFISADHSVVWIEWQGSNPLTLLFSDGQVMSGAAISDKSVKCDDFELSMEHAAIIRCGSLGNTVFSKVPSILKLAPVEFLNVKEEKFLSDGLFKSESGEQYGGWVIHEKIIWP